MFDLSGKVAIVTGGSRGIGRAMAYALAGSGANVFISYSSDDGAAEEAVRGLEKICGFGNALKADVSDTDAVKEMIGKVVEEAGTVHILINNAGIIRDSLLLLMKDEDWQRVIDVNLKGVYNCSRAVLRPMIAEKWGRIINIISPSALMGRPGQTNYAAAKGGIYSFTKSLAREVASYGINVNALSPGVIDTELTDGLDDKLMSELLSLIPLGRLGTVEEVANAACFLASERSGYITGELLSVDGGMT